VSGVTYREVDAKTLTRLRGIVDPWFLGRYGMNLYRGCEHGCAYCDGRAERYHVAGDFERDIAVKRNAAALLRRELGRAREPGFVLLGGGVCDAYQPAEARYHLAREVLEVVLERGFAVHVLTKSILVERDFDLLAEIGRRTRAILSVSLQTVDDAVRARFEPRAPPVAERLDLVRRARELGLGVGAMAMPVLPGISDRPEAIGRLVDAVADVGADFVCFAGLTLRPGVQKEAYLRVLREHYPDLVDGYGRAYAVERPSGAPDGRYLARVEQRFFAALERRALPARPPRRLFAGQMPLYAELGVRLEHRELERRRAGGAGLGLGRAGAALQNWARDRLSAMGRRPGLCHHLVEEELLDRVRTGELAEIPGLVPAAVQEVGRMLSADVDCP
jgi:DNA repair photolyase